MEFIMKLISNVEVQLRNLIVYHSELVKELTISKREATIIQLAISRNGITTNHVMDMYGNSAQSASASLRKLKHKGYLVSAEMPDPTGGYYLEYTPSEFITSK